MKVKMQATVMGQNGSGAIEEVVFRVVGWEEKGGVNRPLISPDDPKLTWSVWEPSWSTAQWVEYDPLNFIH